MDGRLRAGFTERNLTCGPFGARVARSYSLGAFT